MRADYRQRLLRSALLGLGWLCVALGLLGALLPLLPTTPFMLLAVFCFMRSSRRLSFWLLRHRHFGPLLRNYLRGQGIPRKAKLYSLLMLWGGLGLSAPWLPHPLLHGVLALCGLSASLFILTRKTTPPR